METFGNWVRKNEKAAWELIKRLPGKIWDWIKSLPGKTWDIITELYYIIADYFSGAEKRDCNGKEYNSDRLCCSPAKGPLPRDRIKNLADCEQRHQNKLQSPGVNGCIVSSYDKVTGIGHNDNPTGGENTTFYWACKAHNRCYYECIHAYYDGANRSNCDKELWKAMDAKCDAAGNLSAKCNAYKREYHNKITEINGLKSYETAQKRNCTCCAEGQK